MTVPPLPPNPTFRCMLKWSTAEAKMGSRFYIRWSGTTPTATICNALATAIEGVYAAQLGGRFASDMTLVEIDLLDVTTHAGASGLWSGASAGTAGPPSAPFQCAVITEYLIARRYRGGKPKAFWPPGPQASLTDPTNWSAAYVSAWNTDIAAFFSGIAGLANGGCTLGAQINLSFYNGFTNHTDTSGRAEAVPTYRAVCLEDTITGYNTRQKIGSQRRRRASTSF